MSQLQFETPENVPVSYASAGLGTRYVAWFVDQFFVWLATFALIVTLACAGVSFAGVEELLRDVGTEGGSEEAVMYIIGLIMLVWGLGSFVYFGVSELWMRGQTFGKRMAEIRVVKMDGFSLDASSILVRNVFRVVDHIPPLWIVPVLSARSQRLGDMVAGTVVVRDEKQQLSPLRSQLAERSALESEFRFDTGVLARLSETDAYAIEQLLERWDTLPPEQQVELVTTIVPPLCQKLKIEEPEPDRAVRFLEDLLAADIRRQRRSLG